MYAVQPIVVIVAPQNPKLGWLLRIAWLNIETCQGPNRVTRWIGIRWTQLDIGKLVLDAQRLSESSSDVPKLELTSFQR
jgi:hypothetical protein